MASVDIHDRDTDGIADIEALAKPNVAERGRQRFCSALRRYAIQAMPEKLQKEFEEHVKPNAEAKGEQLDTALKIEDALRNNPTYQLYSTLRYNAQEMCFLSVQDSVERVLPEMIAIARDAHERNPAGGSLRLNPNLDIPRYVSALDVHLTPGCFHNEWAADDVAQGAVVNLGSGVFTASMAFRSKGGVARVISRWLKDLRPDFQPLRILDLGTTSGKNLTPYHAAYPDAEIYGVDVGAPLLRYGHALAQHENVPVHFSQQNAEDLDFPDQHFDLIVSSFFFHEIPVKATRNVLAQCRRLLKPGGIMVHQELPASNLVDAWEDYFWNWDTDNNNEPFYTAFRAQDPIKLMVEAGFAEQDSFAHILPDIGAFPNRAQAFAWDEPGRPRHGKGGWYVFGASLPA